MEDSESLKEFRKILKKLGFRKVSMLNISWIVLLYMLFMEEKIKRLEKRIKELEELT